MSYDRVGHQVGFELADCLIQHNIVGGEITRILKYLIIYADVPNQKEEHRPHSFLRHKMDPPSLVVFKPA